LIEYQICFSADNMAGASDKARFYLEQSVPELREYERKGIFTTVRYRISLLCLLQLTGCRLRSPALPGNDPTLNTN
jgi:hypothetical protein